MLVLVLVRRQQLWMVKAVSPPLALTFPRASSVVAIDLLLAQHGSRKICRITGKLRALLRRPLWSPQWRSATENALGGRWEALWHLLGSPWYRLLLK